MHRASGPAAHFVPQKALTRFPSTSRTPPSACPGSEVVCASAVRCSSSSCPSPLSHLSTRFHFGPPPGRSMASAARSDFVSKSARFSADVHAPTMNIPRFTNCCSQRTFVDKCRMVPTPSRLHMPRAAALSSKSSVRTSSPMNNWTSRIMLQHSTQLRHLSARVPCTCVMKNTADTHQLDFPNLIDFSCP